MKVIKRFLSFCSYTIIRSLTWVVRNQNALVFAIFLVLATGFWFLNSLRRSYATTISIPVHFVNLPNQKILITQSDSTEIQIKVKATGFSLLRYHFSPHFSALELDVMKMKRFYKGNSRGVYFSTNDIEARVSNHLGNELELLSLSPDTVFLNFYNKSNRKLPVKLQASLEFAPSFYQSGPVKIIPDSIEVAGPNFVMDTMTYISTQYINLNQIKSELVTKLPLQYDKSVVVSSNDVLIKIPCEAYTESSVMVPINVKGLGEDVTVKTFPSDIKVSFRVALSQFDLIRANAFMAVVDVTGVDFHKQKRLKVRLDKVPDYVYSIEYNPLFVDYLVERNKISQ